MIITVAICTLNRAESLRRTLESLASMQLWDDLSWEIVIVNNNCTDHTDEVISAFVDRLPLRREFEPQRGLSRARNRAVETAKGDYIIWTDDDVVVDPGWLAAYGKAFRRWPEAAVFGGRIIPKYTTPVPKWIAESEAILWDTVFAGRDFGDEFLPLSEMRLPYGPNFALRATEQRMFRYNTDLGHAANQRRRGEETDVVMRILRSGASGYWVPQAQVEHCSDATQQTRDYVARYFATCGETMAFNERPAAPLLFGVSRWLWRRLAEEWVGYQIHRLVSPAPVWVKHFAAYWYISGQIRYWRHHKEMASTAV